MSILDKITAKIEAAKTPFKPGTIVGHTDFDRFGAKEALFVKYTGEHNENIVVITGEGHIVTWTKEGAVDVDLVTALHKQIMEEAQNALLDIQALDMLGELLYGAVEGIIENCDCPDCQEAKALLAEAKAKIAPAAAPKTTGRKLEKGCFCGQCYAEEDTLS